MASRALATARRARSQPAAPGAAVQRLDSVHSSWLFDTERKRFRRVPRGADLTGPSIDRDWEPYHALEIDSETGAFTVALNPEGTRLLRSWLAGSEPSSPPDDPTERTAELALQPVDEP